MAAISFQPLRANTQNLSAETLLHFLISFIAKRVYHVGWEFPPPAIRIPYEDTYQPQKALFIKLLKSSFPKQDVGEQLKKIILNESVWLPLLDNRHDKAFIPCYATYILKELGELETIIQPAEIQNLVTKVLTFLEDSFEVYSPAKDEALTLHYSQIRREAIDGLEEVVKICSPAYSHNLIQDLLNIYQNVDHGNGIKRPLRFNGEIWGIKSAIISILSTLTSKAPPEDIESIFHLFSNVINNRFDRKELRVLRAIEKMAQAAPHKIPSILLLIIKIVQEEESSPNRSLDTLFSSPKLTLETIIKNIPAGAKSNIRLVLDPLAKNQENPESRFAAEAIRMLDAN